MLLDTLAVDRRDRTVPGLTADDFEVIVGGEPRPVDTLDADCAGAPLADPRGVADPADRTATPSAGAGLTVLVFDYMHLSQVQRFEVLQSARDLLAADRPSGERYLVAALTDRLRVELAPTDDAAALDETLQRMQQDITLWARRYDHLHELRWFDLLTALLDILSREEGSKAVVLYSDLLGVADEYDPQYDRLATSAATVRARFYPVLARGLDVVGPGRGQPTGGPPALARLAVDSGGRLTRNTNDLSLGWARARRDRACRYTVGFYDRRADGEAPRPVTIRSRRPGVRIVHPGVYAFQEPVERRRALHGAALLAPEAFPAGGLEARVVPLAPHGPRRHDVRIEIDPPPGSAPGPEATLTVLLYAGPTELRRFEHPPSAGPLKIERRISRRVDRIAVVLDDPRRDEVLAVRVPVVLPPPPAQ